MTYDSISKIRTRPGMYIGSTGPQGIRQIIRELCGNSIDQFLSGKASFLKVKALGDKITVTDDGPGLPFDIPKEGAENLASHYLTTFHDSPMADSHAPHIHVASWMGIGLIAVNALCETLVCESWRAGQLWRQVFKKGCAGGPARVVETGNGKGTQIQCLLDPEIFRFPEIPLADVAKELQDAAYLYPGIKIELNDQVFLKPNGLVNLVEDKFGVNSKYFYSHLNVEDFDIQIAICDQPKNQSIKGGKSSTEWETWVNGCRTIEGGTHHDTCEKVLMSLNWVPRLVGLHIIMKTPKFAGPIRACLEAPIVAEVLTRELPPLFVNYLEFQ